MATLIENNAATTLTGPAADDATSINLTDGSDFPQPGGDDHFYATLEDNSGNREIVKVTSRSGNTATVVRAQDDTSAAAWAAGTKFELRMNKKALDERYFVHGSTEINQQTFNVTGDTGNCTYGFGIAPTHFLATKTVNIGTDATYGSTTVNIGEAFYTGSGWGNCDINLYGDVDSTLLSSSGFKIHSVADKDTNVYITNPSDAQIANLEIRGDSGKQGTGRLYLGQNPLYGCGMVYFGDNSPTISTNMGGTGSQDRLTFFRRSNDVDYWLFRSNNPQGNNMDFRGNITAYASDERLKTNITPITNPLEKLQQVRGVEYDWRDDVEEKGFIPSMPHETGVIAQEVQQVVPDAVVPAPFDSEYLTVDHVKLIPLLIESIKELKEEVDSLKAKVGSQS